jgi:hypothetical protein
MALVVVCFRRQRRWMRQEEALALQPHRVSRFALYFVQVLLSECFRARRS